MQQPKLDLREKIGYGIGAMGEGLAFNLVGSFFMLYCTDYLGISAWFMALLYFFARFWDAVNDPMMGTLSENIKTKWGKHRPWIVLGAVTNAIVMVCMFSPGLRRLIDPRLAVAVLYVLFGMTYTIIDVPYYAYAASFVNLKERDQIAVIPRVFGSLGTIGIPALTLPLVALLGRGNDIQGYFRWAAILSAVYVLCALFAAASMKKRELNTRAKPFTFGEALKILKNNDQLLIIETVFVLIFTAVTMTTSVALYYFKYVWRQPEAYGTFTLMAGAGMGIAMLSYYFLAKRISRRTIFIISLILPIIGYVLMFVISIFTNKLNNMLPAVVLTMSGFGFTGILSSIFMVDTVDYGEWKLGCRSENIIFSLLTFMGIFSGAISSLVTMVTLYLAGYVSTKADLMGNAGTAAQITAQPPAVGSALNVLMFAVPPVILLTALLLYLKKYKLHGAYMEKIKGDLDERRQ